MKKSGFTIIEVVFVFFLILGVTFLVFSKSLENTRQAKLTLEWIQKYSDIQYMFSAIKTQQGNTIKEKLKNTENNKEKKEILLETIKPYLRIKSEVGTDYKQFYMNKQIVPTNSRYYFNKFYSSSSGDIIGLKWLGKNCKSNDICAMITFDINGLNPPNTWGYDIFGINIYQNNIEPLGKNISSDALRIDCSKEGFGIYCSYYYLIGGQFD